MRVATALGSEIMAGCGASTSTMWALARLAMNICRYGGMTLSSVPTRYQDGIVFQAGGPDGSALALNVIGRCEAARTAACLAAMVLAKHEGYTSGLIYRSTSPFCAPGYGTMLNNFEASLKTQEGDAPGDGCMHRSWNPVSPSCGAKPSI